MSRGPPRGHSPVRRVWLRRLTWGVGGLAVLLLVLGIGIALSLDALVRMGVRRSLEQKTGAGVRLDAARLGVSDGALHLRSLVLSNPPGFGPAPLLSVPELYLRYDLQAASSNVLRFAEVRLHLAELNVVVDREGRTNVTELAGLGGVGGLTDGSGREVSLTNLLSTFQFGGIERLTLTLGRFRLVDERDPRKNLQLDVGISNRTLTEVDSLAQLMPLVVEIALKGGLKKGVPVLSVPTNAPALR